MTNEDRKPCSARVFGERVQSWQCQSRGIVLRGGKYYCRRHDPERNTAGPDAALIWVWERYDDKPRRFVVAHRTAKLVVAGEQKAPTFGTAYARNFLVSQERTQLGMALSRVRSLEADTTPLPGSTP